MREFNKTFIYYKFNLMFTILNIINYFTGKYIPPYLLILITISIYFFIIHNWFNDLINGNIIYLILLLLIMLIDITSIIIIFTTSYNNNENENENDNDNDNNNIETIKKKLKKHNRKKNDKKNNNNLNENLNNNNIENDNKEDDNKEDDNKEDKNITLKKDIISLYDNEKAVSLKTYHLI